MRDVQMCVLENTTRKKEEKELTFLKSVLSSVHSNCHSFSMWLCMLPMQLWVEIERQCLLGTYGLCGDQHRFI